MELTTTTQLAFFAAAFGGVALGALVGWLTCLELGLGMGLLVPGLVAAWYGVQCVEAYRAFAPALTLPGVVIDVRDEATTAAGSVTQQRPYVRFRDAQGVDRLMPGPRASGWQRGQRLRVLPDGMEPSLIQRVGDPTQLRGAAIAMLLFGTFTLSLGAWFSVGALAVARTAEADTPQRRRRMTHANVANARDLAPDNGRIEHRNKLFALGLLGAMVWITAGSGALIERFAVGFGLIASVLVCYAGWLTRVRLGDWHARSGLVVLALNFGVFAAALWLLSPAGGG